jgi:hypothetical protein
MTTRAQLRQQHPNWDANRLAAELDRMRAAGGGGVAPAPPQVAPVGAPAPAPAPNPFGGATRSDIRQDHPNWNQNRIATALGQAKMDVAPAGGGPAAAGVTQGGNLLDPTGITTGSNLSKNQIQRKHPNWDADRIRRMMGGGAAPPDAAGVGGLPGATGATGGGIFAGPQGEGYAQNHIPEYLTALLTAGGLLTNDGTPASMYIQENAVANLQREFAAAQAVNENLTITQFMQQTYGAGFDPAGAASTGSLSANTLARQGQDFFQNQNPDLAIDAAMQAAGMFSGTGNPQDVYMQQQARQEILRQFYAAQNANPTLTMSAFLAQNPQLMNPATYAADARNYFLNQNPEVGINAAVDQSGVLGANESAQFRDYVTSDGLDMVRARLDAARAGDPSFNVGDFFGGGGMPADLMTQMRRAYQNRPDYRRLPSVAPTGGRWSWWA